MTTTESTQAEHRGTAHILHYVQLDQASICAVMGGSAVGFVES